MSYIREIYNKFKNESIRPMNEETKNMYLIPCGKDLLEQGYGVLSEKAYNLRLPEFQKRCKKIEVTDKVGTKFNAIVLNVVTDVFDNEDYWYEQTYKTSTWDEETEDSMQTEFLAIPIGKPECWQEDFYADLPDYNEEGLTITQIHERLNSGELTEENLKLLKECFDDYQGFGWFEGVATITEEPEIIDVDKFEAVEGNRKNEEFDTYAIAWTEFNNKDQIVSKQKEFKTAKARDTFVKKLQNNSKFNEITATSDPEKNEDARKDNFGEVRLDHYGLILSVILNEAKKTLDLKCGTRGRARYNLIPARKEVLEELQADPQKYEQMATDKLMKLFNKFDRDLKYLMFELGWELEEGQN